MQTRTDSNPATRLWKFSSCGGFRFRVGQADERHPNIFISQHLSAVVSVAQHIRRAATLKQFPETQPDLVAVGARRSANCDEPFGAMFLLGRD
jgi:hypothetical protein